MAIDAQEDESARQETVREFEITDVGESRVCHEGERVITVGIISSLSFALSTTLLTHTMNAQDHNQLLPCPPTHNTRPASPFFRHRPLGRAPSPPTWACYEQIPARSDLLGSSDSDSDSGEAADEDSLSDVDSSSSSSSSDEDGEEHEDAPPAEAEADAQAVFKAEGEAEAAGLMDVELDKGEAAASAHPHRPSTGDPEKRDKGKQRADDPPNAVTGGGKSVPVVHSRSRRPRGRRPPVSVLRPILTIQRSQGFVWNQVSFLSLFSPFAAAASMQILLRERCAGFKSCNRTLTMRRNAVYRTSSFHRT